MAKSRATYSKEMRSEAKAKGLGLVTISVSYPNGEIYELQMPADPVACRCVAWTGGLIESGGEIPDIESEVRRLLGIL
jgi:hypothetical protein